ncbi:unnamed protein product [Mucor hiemalis]
MNNTPLLSMNTSSSSAIQTRIKEPSFYDGTRDALLIDGWIRSVERYTTFNTWTPERSCLFATTLLRDRADAWFRTIELTDEAPTTCLEFKKLLIEFFRPDNSVRIARDKLAVLTQTNDVVTYINQFMDIKLAIPGMTDEEACDKFVRGLNNKQMRSHIRQYEANGLKEAIHAALAFDSAQQEGNYSFGPRPAPAREIIRDDPMDLDYAEGINNNNNGRFNSGQRYNNGYRDNRNNGRNSFGNSGTSSGTFGGRNTSCYHFHKPGHMKRNCRARIADIRKLDGKHSKKDFQST